MKIKPIWAECKKCKGVGHIKVETQSKNAAEKPGVTVPECPDCGGSGQVRTDSLHRQLTLLNGDMLIDTSLPEGKQEICCMSTDQKTCGAGCAAFDVRSDEKGKTHYACCAGMPKHIIGVITNA